MEYTLSIIKPDALERNITGQINAMIEKEGLKIIAQKMIHLSQKETAAFYAEHEGKAFFDSLVAVMSAAPIIVQVLKGDNAIKKYIDIMGSTNPQAAKEGTIRKQFGLSISKNAVHGSDSIESAQREICFLFSNMEIFA